MRAAVDSDAALEADPHAAEWRARFSRDGPAIEAHAGHRDGGGNHGARRHCDRGTVHRECHGISHAPPAFFPVNMVPADFGERSSAANYSFAGFLFGVRFLFRGKIYSRLLRVV